MVYKIVISPRARNEILKAHEYYSIDIIDAPVNFSASLVGALQHLAKNPFYRVRYKNVRAVKIKKFPYLLYFTINENKYTFRILSCFYVKRNPVKRPRF